MTRFRHILVTLLAATPLGCARPAQRPAADAEPAPPLQWEFTRPPRIVQSHDERPLPVESKPTLIKQGRVPLVYLIETPIEVLVVDESTGLRLASATAPAGSIVRVDAGGVFLGPRRLAAGPLATDRTYGIYTAGKSPNAIITDTFAPSPATVKGETP